MKQDHGLVWKTEKVNTETDCQGESGRGVLEENMLLQKDEMPLYLFSSALHHPSKRGARQVTAQLLRRFSAARIWDSKTLQPEAVNIVCALAKVCAK